MSTTSHHAKTPPADNTKPQTWGLVRKHLWVVDHLIGAGITDLDQLRVFLYVARYPGKTNSQVEEDLGIAHTSCGRYLGLLCGDEFRVVVNGKRLRNLGLIHQDYADPERDRRLKGYWLTPRGKRLVQDMQLFLGERDV